MLKLLAQMSEMPSEKAAFDAWLELKDVVPFLLQHTRANEFIVYAACPHFFVHTVVVPTSSVSPPDVEDLMRWSSGPSSQWGYSHTFTDPPEISLSPPLSSTGSQTLDGGEQLVFMRYFEGRLDDDKNYFEVLQKFVQIFDLHFMPERNAYCRLNKHGDIEDAIRIMRLPGVGGGYSGTAVTFERKILGEYAALTDATLVLLFDFTRCSLGSFKGWSNNHEAQQIDDGDIFYRIFVQQRYASYMRGCQVIRSREDRDTLVRRLVAIDDADRKYASFVALDWKNKRVREISCAPGETANYFTESELPFEMSPAFFRPEVLAKYKADSDKYRLEERSISCRGAWNLETYDINEAGQVHTYVAYLRRLPYEEQLHWKAYNEVPKGTISKRAFMTDFEGRWDYPIDPLEIIKQAVRELATERPPWWTLRSETLLDRVHHPVTDSADEWAEELMRLDQLIVEGFEERWLRQKAESLLRKPAEQVRSLALLEECLRGLGFEEEHTGLLLEPLREVHNLRSKLKGHASGQEATAIKKDVLKRHGTFRAHFRSLCVECARSIGSIREAFQQRN